MKTVLTKSAKEAAEYIKRGGIVAFPTETVLRFWARMFFDAAGDCENFRGETATER